jgi:hypothetical protein
LVLDPGEVELAQGQLVFGTDGLLGTIQGALTTEDLDTIGAVLVSRSGGGKGRAPAAVPTALVDDWATMDVGLSCHELDTYGWYALKASIN